MCQSLRRGNSVLEVAVFEIVGKNFYPASRASDELCRSLFADSYAFLVTITWYKTKSHRPSKHNPREWTDFQAFCVGASLGQAYCLFCEMQGSIVTSVSRAGIYVGGSNRGIVSFV